MSNPVGVPFSGFHSVFGALQRPEKDNRRSSLVGVQVAVPATHRQAVALSNGLDRADLDRQVQVGDHPANHGELLIILGAEVGDVGLGDREELEDDGRHPLEMTRTARAFEER